MTEKCADLLKNCMQNQKSNLFRSRFLMIPYLKNALYLENPCKYEVPITVLVESDMPNLMTKNYIEQLQGHFNYLYNVTFIDVFQLTRKKWIFY